jgi:DNA-binding response OmpR family regulator/class 3 adenylate cyclase
LIVAQGVGSRAAIVRLVRAAGYPIELAETPRRARELITKGGIGLVILTAGQFGSAGIGLAEEWCDSVGHIVLIADSAEEAERYARGMPHTRVVRAPPNGDQELTDYIRLVMSASPEDGRAEPPRPEALSFSGRTIDISGRTFRDADGREIALTRAEFSALLNFVRNSGHVLSREQLRRAIGRDELEPYDRAIDMLVSRLRRKIEPEPKNPRFIVTVPGFGYKFEVRARQGGEPANAVGQASVVDDAAPSRSGIAERRQLTVLASAVIGLTVLAAELDPEDFQALISSLRQEFTRVVGGFGGFVASFLGDRLIAYFGYPQAHEDDAERAIHAALALRAALPPQSASISSTLRASFGIARGQAVVTPLSLEGSRDTAHSAVGEAASSALSLQASARPDNIVVSAATRSLAGGGFDYRRTNLVTGGSGERIAAWQVVAERPQIGRFAAYRNTGSASLVGRAEELALLSRRWATACARVGQIVFLLGAPGIGKSRLTVEFAEQAGVDDRRRLEFFGSPHHRNQPLFPIISHIERRAGFAHADTVVDKLAKLRDFLLRSGIGADEAMPVLGSLLSLPSEDGPAERIDVPALRERTFLGLLGLFEKLSSQHPMLVLFDDMQWFDATSLEFFARLVEHAPRWPALLVATARPEYHDDWIDHPQVTVIRLARLGLVESEALVRSLAGPKKLPERAVREIIARADGVPLFLEELTRMVLDSISGGASAGVREWAHQDIPETLQSLLLARLDQLGPARDVAQIGAAIGRSFTSEMMSRLDLMAAQKLDDALARLVASGLVLRREAPEPTYTFKHALVRDAAYSLLPRRRRGRVHARIAEVLEAHFPDIVDGQPELLAHHHEEAGDAAKAVRYLVIAGKRALLRSAATEALAEFEHAVRLIGLLPENERRRDEADLWMLLSRAYVARYSYASPQAREAFARARTLSNHFADYPELPLVVLGQGVTAWLGADYGAMLRHARDLYHLAERRGDAACNAMADLLCGVASMLTGKLQEGRRYLERALAAKRFVIPGTLMTWESGVRNSALVHLQNCLFLLGHAGLADVTARRAILEWPSDPYSRAISQSLVCRTYLIERYFGKAAELVVELERLATERGFLQYIGSAMVYRGRLLAETPRAAEEGAALCRNADRRAPMGTGTTPTQGAGAAAQRTCSGGGLLRRSVAGGKGAAGAPP